MNWNDILIFCCLLPTLIFMGLVFFAVQRGLRFLQWFSPSDERLIEQFVAMKEEKPNANTRQLVGQFIHQQAIRSGIVGAVTSVGGAFTLPIGLPIDLLTTARFQNTTLALIAYAYELENPGEVPKVLDVNEVLGLKQGGLLKVDLNETTQQLALVQSERFASYATRQAMLVVGEKAFAKFIPGLGLFIGFAVNYTLTRALMQAAVEWYSGNVGRYGDQLKAAREKVGGISVSPALIESGQKLAGQMGLIRRALDRTNVLK